MGRRKNKKTKLKFLKNKINIYLYIVQPYKNKKVFIFYA